MLAQPFPLHASLVEALAVSNVLLSGKNVLLAVYQFGPVDPRQRKGRPITKITEVSLLCSHSWHLCLKSWQNLEGNKRMASLLLIKPTFWLCSLYLVSALPFPEVSAAAVTPLPCISLPACTLVIADFIAHRRYSQAVMMHAAYITCLKNRIRSCQNKV